MTARPASLSETAPEAGSVRPKPGLLSHVSVKLSEAFAWFLYAWVLAFLLPSFDLGRVLYVLVFSGCAAAILTVGWKAWMREEAARTDLATIWSVAMAGFAMRAMIVLPVIVLVSAKVGGMVLSPAPEMPLLIALLAGLIAWLRLASYGIAARGEPAGADVLRGPLPVLLAIAAVLITAKLRPIPFDLVLALHAACLLVPIVLGHARLPRLKWSGDLPAASVFAASLTQSGALLFRNVDILVIGLVLAPAECAIYLMARGITTLLDLLFRVLGRALAEPMAFSLNEGSRRVFVAQAARANLGFLLIGGAGALLLMVAADPLLGLFGITAPEGRQTLIWLIVAQGAPAVFGATHLFMRLARLEGLRAWIVWPALPLALILAFSAAQEGIVALATTFAALQIAFFGTCALVVALRCGIWPGLTAMFCGGIRLR